MSQYRCHDFRANADCTSWVCSECGYDAKCTWVSYNGDVDYGSCPGAAPAVLTLEKLRAAREILAAHSIEVEDTARDEPSIGRAMSEPITFTARMGLPLHPSKEELKPAVN